MISSLLSGGVSQILGQKSARLAIGLDVGSKSIKAVQLARSRGGKPRVTAALARPRTGERGPLTAAEIAILAVDLGAAGFGGNRTVLAAPAQDVLIGPLELPPRSSQAPLDQLARMEVARNFRCGPDTFELAWWEMPSGIRGGRGTHALAVAFPHARAEAVLGAFDASALRVEALEAEPTAMLRACQGSLIDKGITAILDLGWGQASLSFVHQGVLTFSRRIPEGSLEALHQSLCKALGVEPDVADYLLTEIGLDGGPQRRPGDEDEPIEMPDGGRRLISAFSDALVKELTLSFSYATHQYPDIHVAKLLLVGGGAQIPGIAGALAQPLGVEAARIAPVELAECDAAVLSLCSSPAMTLAFGLALREVQS